MTALDAAKIAALALDDKKGHDIKILKIEDLTVIADYFVIASGTSTTQVKALAGEVEHKMKEAGFELLHYEDRSADLTAMAAQMIFDGSMCGCMDVETLHLLRRVKAGYGLWVYKKEED